MVNGCHGELHSTHFNPWVRSTMGKIKVRFGLVYWGLTPQQQPGSYQGSVRPKVRLGPSDTFWFVKAISTTGDSLWYFQDVSTAIDTCNVSPYGHVTATRNPCEISAASPAGRQRALHTVYI